MSNTGHASDRRVLLVEDEPRLRDMLLRAMREMSFEASAAASAEQAIRILERHPHSVLVVDLNLPARSGMDLLREVRARWPQIQAVILTGFGDLSTARQAIHLDVVDFLTKPCGLGDLEIALDRAFQRLPRRVPPITLREPSEDHNEDDNCAPAGHEKSRARPSAPTLAFEPLDTREALSIEDVERRTILAALQRHQGNRHAAANELGISLRKLYYRLAQYHKQGLLPS